MKKKHLFSAVALAAVFAGCSQDELISESNFQEADDRPTVEAPVITLGADTRMTTSNSYAGVTWEAGDGFGAMLMDTYVPKDASGKDNTEWSKLFPIQNYVSSNVLYKTEDGKNFTAEASLKQGNYLFYAPFNEENFKREPLAVKLPLVQNVVPSATKEPSNTAIKEFYEAKTYPVFVAYDSIWNTPKTNLSLNMKHIYALPKITLKLGKVQLLDENGSLKVDNKKNPVYETSIAIDSIRFASKAIVTSGTINNENLIAKIGKDSKGKVAWDETKYESAATAEIVEADDDKQTVVVKFSPALTISATKAGEFFMVLPGAQYSAGDLAVEVYTTIDGKAYVSAESSLSEKVQTILPFRGMRLLPGLPYSADEYNADGTMKETKGTSATYTVAGGFIPAETAISGYTEIKNYAELTDFINKVAYRGEPLIEITKTEAERIIADENIIPDPKKYFVITVDEKSPIELDDAFVATFKNACVIEKGEASIAFRVSNKQVTLGDIEYSTDDPIRFNVKKVEYDKETSEIQVNQQVQGVDLAYVTGNVVLSGKSEPAFGTLNIGKNASVELSDDLNSGTWIRVENNGGEVVSYTSSPIKINNRIGNVTINKAPNQYIDVVNGTSEDPVEKDNIEYYAVMNINANMDFDTKDMSEDMAKRRTIKNNHYGKVNVSRCSAILINDGLVVAVDEVAKIEAKDSESTSKERRLVDNTNNGKVTVESNTKQTVFARISGSDGADGFAKYDELSKLNKIELTGAWNISDNFANVQVAGLFSSGSLKGVKTIDFNAGSSLYVGSNVTLDLSTVDKININDDVTWSGRSAEISKVELKDEESTIIVCAVKDDKGKKYTHTKVDVTVQKKTN